MSRLLPFVLCTVIGVYSGSSAVAQEPPVDLGAPAHVSAVSGTASLERNGASEAVLENLPLLEGDRLRTNDTSRIEILLPDTSVLALDRQTTIDLLSGGLVRLVTGRLIFVVANAAQGGARNVYQVDAQAARVKLAAAGEYRLAASVVEKVPFLSVAVVRGEASVDANGQARGVRAGQQVQATLGQGITASGTFNSAQSDAFVQWAEGLRGERVGSTSNAYLPPDLQVYGGTFDREGTWDNAGGDGYAWYPRVSSDWRPYYDGGWQPYDWGWTWVGSGSWIWATHHYGRWGHGDRGWYWLPGASWGPGWVSWGVADNLVGWCPLGYNDSPVFSFSFGFSWGSRNNPWLGWTVVPDSRFGRGYAVSRYALHGATLRGLDHRTFTLRTYGPTMPRMASGRLDNNAQPWERAQAVAAQRTQAGQAPAGAQPRATYGPGERPTVAERPWTPNQDSPYGRAQAVAGARLEQTAPGASARMRAYDTRPFASPDQAPLPYPQKYQTPVGSAWNEPLGDVARRTTGAPSAGPSRAYRLGPSTPRPQDGGTTGATDGTAAPRRDAPVGFSPARSFQGPTSQQDLDTPTPRSYQDYVSAVRSASRPSAVDRAEGARPSSGGRRTDDTSSARPAASSRGSDGARPTTGSSAGRPSGSGIASPSRGGSRSSGGSSPRGGHGK